MQKMLIILGISLLVLGILYPLIKKSGFGGLPGDIFLKGDSGSFYFPIMTCLVIHHITHKDRYFLRSLFSLLPKDLLPGRKSSLLGAL